MKFEKQIILVTAATRGIGLATVKAAAQEGATVYMAARDMDRARELTRQMDSMGWRVHCVYNDATKPETFQTMVDEVIKNEGRIDTLVNNFGYSDPKVDLDIAHTKPEDFPKIVELNVRSVFLASQAAILHMRDIHKGNIVNISAIDSEVPNITQIAYGTAKAAINHMTKQIAVQEARHRIRCNAVLPGITATDALDEMPAEFHDQVLRHTPIPRFATKEEIAEAVLYFASPTSTFTTGQLLTVGGGFGMPTPLFTDMIDQLEGR